MEERAVILIVDDEQSVRRAINRELRDEDADILLAGSGDEALALLESHRVDVVISDLRMPGMNGVTLLSAISERWPDIARILLTGNADFPDIVKAINEGNISYFLEKPWSREQLQLIVRQFLRQASLRNTQERLSLELAAKHDALVSEIEIKNRLMAIMSHEIRTPLNGIHSVLQLLEEGVEDPRELRELVEVGLSSSTGLRKIVDDVLDYFRLGTDEVAIESRSFSPSRVVNEVFALMRPAAREKSLDMELVGEAALPAHGTGDALRLRQVLTNLLSNAVRYTDHGLITIDCTKSAADQLIVSVIDTGPGIPEEKLPLVFEEFRLLDDSHARRQGGTGLGLAICRRLVERMAGELEVSSTVGEGSRFTLTLPLGEPDQAAVIEESGDYSARLNRRVAIVDDHVVNLQLLTLMLERMGCEVVAYDSAALVVADFRDPDYVRPDILLTDITMPGMDGIQLTGILRDESLVDEDFPIVALTAHNMASEVERFLAAGMTAHLAKPVVRAELYQVIVGQLEQAENVLAGSAIEDLAAEVGPEAMPVLIESFLRDTRARAAAISDALAQNDFEALAAECHTLGSSAAQFGAKDLSVACREVESLIKVGDAERARERAGAIDPAVHSSIELIESFSEGL